MSADGDYKTVTGETGYLGLQENMEEEIRKGNDVIANAAVPGKSQLLVFATPNVHGSYQGFEYDAIAIAYENADIVKVLDLSLIHIFVSVSIEDMQGRTAVSNTLPFHVYTGEETLAEELVTENLKHYAGGKYAWNIMEP